MHTRLILAATLGLMLFCYGCGSKQENDTSYNEYEKPDTTSGIQQMKDYHYSAEVKDKNTTYTYDIVREVGDSLPAVQGDDNTQYADNYIRLRVNRNGQEIFNKVFTKNLFAPQLDKDFLRHSLLEGMAFDSLSPEGLRFSISISYPESDLYIPFSVLVSPNGSYSITKEEILDTIMEKEDSITEP